PPTKPPTTTPPPSAPTAPPKPTANPNRRPKKQPKRTPNPPPRPKPNPGPQPLHVPPPLAPGTYDFPVTGNVSWGDTYGAERSDVPGGWHHGDDLFAPLGTPVVAVADGTVFAVGWDHVGGVGLGVWIEARGG